MFLAFPSALAVTVQATVGVELTVTPEAPRPVGVAVGGAGQVPFPSGYGQGSAPTVGYFLGGRWGDPSFRRFVLGVRGGVSWAYCCGLLTHWDIGSTEAEVGIAFRRDEGPSLDLGLHASAAEFGQLGYDVERDFRRGEWNTVPCTWVSRPPRFRW